MCCGGHNELHYSLITGDLDVVTSAIFLLGSIIRHPIFLRALLTASTFSPSQLPSKFIPITYLHISLCLFNSFLIDILIMTLPEESSFYPRANLVHNCVSLVFLMFSAFRNFAVTGLRFYLFFLFLGVQKSS